MNPDKYIKILKGKTNQELIQLLEEAYARIEQLEKKNQQSIKAITKYKQSARQQRERTASIEGQLKAEKIKVEALKKTLKKQKIKTREARKKQVVAEKEVKAVRSVIKQIKPKLTKEQVFEMYRNSNQERFWDRITQVHQFDPQKLEEMQARMSTWNSQKLRDIVRVAGWRSTWYDSDAQWNASEVAGWDEKNLYAFIMSY